MRLSTQTATIENGFVWLPEAAPWLADYLAEFAAFPRGRHDDQSTPPPMPLAWIKLRPTAPSGVVPRRCSANDTLPSRQIASRRRVRRERDEGTPITSRTPIALAECFDLGQSSGHSLASWSIWED